MADKKRQRRCTWCGKPCGATGCTWSRHVYGVVSEPRCSQECAANPVVDVDCQRTLEYQGAYVVAAKMAGIQPMSFGQLVEHALKAEGRT